MEMYHVPKAYADVVLNLNTCALTTLSAFNERLQKFIGKKMYVLKNVQSCEDEQLVLNVIKVGKYPAVFKEIIFKHEDTEIVFDNTVVVLTPDTCTIKNDSFEFFIQSRESVIKSYKFILEE